MADPKRQRLWQDPRLYLSCVAVGLVLGATCPLWPEGARPICTSLSQQLKLLGFGQLGVTASGPPQSAADGGT